MGVASPMEAVHAFGTSLQSAIAHHPVCVWGGGGGGCVCVEGRGEVSDPTNRAGQGSTTWPSRDSRKGRRSSS